MDYPPASRSRITSVLIRILIVAVVVGGVGWLLVSSTFSKPDERNRVVHPTGYSIVHPKDWSPHIAIQPQGNALDGITLNPDDWKGLAPSMWVHRLNSPPDPKDLEEK